MSPWWWQRAAELAVMFAAVDGTPFVCLLLLALAFLAWVFGRR